VRWIMRRVSYLARAAGGDNKRRCAIQFLAAVCAQWPSEATAPYLVQIISPLYRLVSAAQSQSYVSPSYHSQSGESNNNNNDNLDGDGGGGGDVAKLAEEAMELVRRRSSPADYTTAYEKVRAMVTELRSKRRQKAAMAAVSDPAVAAQRKISNQRRKLERRKRRSEDVMRVKAQKRIKR